VIPKDQPSIETATGNGLVQLIGVDEGDNVIGPLPKEQCHQAAILHRAFSVFIFNRQGQLLLQRRSGLKLLWPQYWSNSCCSHPRFGEKLEDATQRRIGEELGLSADLEHLYKFRYQAEFEDQGAEHELCHVFVGVSDGPVHPDETEVEEWRWLSIPDLQGWIDRRPEDFTPWFMLEWERIENEYLDRIKRLIATG
jgi:isopentenyl-diphosphate delta-isomerase